MTWSSLGVLTRIAFEIRHSGDDGISRKDPSLLHDFEITATQQHIFAAGKLGRNRLMACETIGDFFDKTQFSYLHVKAWLLR